MNSPPVARPSSLESIAEVLRRSGVSVELRGSGDVVAEGASQDSRTISAGEIFLAWKGTTTDAHDYVASATANGASRSCGSAMHVGPLRSSRTGCVENPPET
jgi:UDP-N-acetylmuramyl pentapeptide synthase